MKNNDNQSVMKNYAQEYGEAQNIISDFKTNDKEFLAGKKALEACRLFVEYDKGDWHDDIRIIINYSSALTAAKEALILAK